MTKEPIMIDDVDVAECRHFNYGEGYNPETEEFVKGACECITAHNEYGEFEYYGICKGRNCYYKQLKHKEQVLEILKVSYKTLVAEQAEIKQYLGICSKTIMERLEELQEFYDEDKIKRFNYEQALRKIKGIAKETSKFYPTKTLEQILQKCEVIDD